MASAKQMVKQIIALLLFASWACSQAPSSPPVHEPRLLANGIPSLESPDEVRRRPEFAAAHWNVIEDSKTVKPSRAGRFDDYVVMIPDYRLGNVTGSLRLEFLNGQLMATWFYPSDYQSCLAELAATGVTFPPSPTDGSGPEISRDGRTIRLGTDYEGRRYVAWEDSQLIDWMNQWLLRNS